MRDIVLAIDPGKLSGWARWNNIEQTFTSGQMEYNDLCRMLVEQGSNLGAGIDVLSEAFVITVQTAKNTQATWSLELIGVARMVSRLYTGQELVLQQPAAAKRLCSDELLRALGWYVPGRGHANDAARHLGLFMLSRGWRDKRIEKFISSR